MVVLKRILICLAIDLVLVACAWMARNGSLTPTQTPEIAFPSGPVPIANPKIFLPMVAVAGSPTPSTSYYINTVDAGASYSLGCTTGARDLSLPGAQVSVVILDFGYPKYVDGYYGASLMGYGPVSTAQIAQAVENFGMGYYNCTGTDWSSHLRIAIGTSNYPGMYNASVSYEHGKAWAEMVNEVNRWLYTRGYGAQVDAVGANDIELSWNDYGPTVEWLNGYDEVNEYPLYNFGAIPGCPWLDRPGSQCGSYPHLWTKDQVWFVIWGSAPVEPIPEIYLTNGLNAEQWYLMSVFAAEAHGQKITFPGVITTYQACQQRGGCSGDGWSIENQPEEGWTQLSTLLKSDPRTVQDYIPYVTDIKWLGE